MRAEAVQAQAVKSHQAALYEAAKELRQRRASGEITGEKAAADDNTEDVNTKDKKKQHSSDSDGEEPVKSLRMEDATTYTSTRDKSASPPPASLVRPDIGAVVSRCIIGGTPSKMGIMDQGIDFTYNQKNITMRRGQGLI